LEELRRFADQKGWLVTDTYKDDGWSGALLERPELDRLRDDASRALFEAVLINDVDRLARDVTHLGVIKRDLELRGVSIIFRKLPAENTPTNNLLVNILGSFAEFERELIADRTRRGRRHKVESRQLFLGCLAPYGFRYLPKRLTPSGTGELVLMPEEADLVRMIYRWVDVEGLSAHQVVRRLNQQRIAPRKRGDSWQKSSVLRILRSEVYAGTWHYNKHSKRLIKGPSAGRRPRVSMRLRSRQDWIPLTLPEHLRLVDRAHLTVVTSIGARRAAANCPRSRRRHLTMLSGPP
jgi:site-specific DNA recombinase